MRIHGGPSPPLSPRRRLNRLFGESNGQSMPWAQGSVATRVDALSGQPQRGSGQQTREYHRHSAVALTEFTRRAPVSRTKPLSGATPTLAPFAGPNIAVRHRFCSVMLAGSTG